MRNAIIFSLAMALGAGVCLAAGWERTYGGSGQDEAYSVAQTSDGGYIIAGVKDYSEGGGLGDVYLVKTNSTGDTLWTKTFGGSYVNYGYSVAQTTDGGYIVAGQTYSSKTGDDVYVLKLNSSGDTVWTRTYGGNDDGSYFIAQTSDGGYIIAGYTGSFPNSDVYLIKTNSSGDLLWQRTFGGSGRDQGRSVAQTTDGGYIVAGMTESFGAGNADVYLVKTNSSGDTVWTHAYGGSGNDIGYSVAQTSDGGYIVAGGTESFGASGNDVYVLKLTSSGDTEWSRTYDGSSASSIVQTTDGGYIIAGQTYSSKRGDDVYVLKLTSSGDTVWTQTYGGSKGDSGRSIAQTSDGGYIIAGYTGSYPNYDVYIIKIDSKGNIK